MPRVRFSHMWAGFQPKSNPLLPILEAAAGQPWEVVLSRTSQVDLEIGSVYPSRWEMTRALVSTAASRGRVKSTVDVREQLSLPGKPSTARSGIWYTPENRRPPAEGWDLTLSFDSDAWPRNAYLPFWQVISDLFGGQDKGLLGEPIRVGELTQARDVRTSRRPGFCCAILRNPEPVRLALIRALSRLGTVDVFGPLARRPVDSKAKILRGYRFALVFENDLYPGYVTEKVFDAWQSQTVPLYWGLDRDGLMNPSAILNMATLSGPEELVQRVADLEKDPQRIDELASQPLLLQAPSAEPILRRIRDLVI